MQEERRSISNRSPPKKKMGEKKQRKYQDQH